MNTTTFRKRAEEIYTQKGEIAARYIKALSYLEDMVKGMKVYPYSWRRYRGHNTLIGENHVNNLYRLCYLLGLDIQTGNSGRGGKEKEYIFLKRNDIAKLKNIDFKEL